MPGPAAGATCSTCNHPGIALINNLINQGASDNKVAGQFQLRPINIRRHRTNQHPGVKEIAAHRGTDLAAVRRAAREEQAGSGDEWERPAEPGDPRARLERLIKNLTTQADEEVRPDVARELRLSLEALAKMGSNEPPPVVRVADVEGLAEMMADMHEALKPWPEARAAMRAVWRRRSGLDDAPEA